ncbi:C39 family peptidase [Serpens gallinarum]|jgi:predicted double-glycine peptidase|uniref:C39 family peptidase n=1 Tax=Serpens gallinarum TaxID=2763075 RepID=A0ABR8TSM7_9PSED|nr:C39 family peptidase [Serpens gallinarum]MBD7978775.1 C39 family peptidase [Serpens gallinarum]
MRLLVVSLLLFICLEAQATRLPFPVLPGGGVAFLDVTSIREQRFSNIVEQKTDFSCGAASLATVLREAYNLDLDEQTVIEGMLVGADQELVRSQGFSMLDMKRYAENLGMRARGYRLDPAGLQQLKVPVVVLQEVRGYKHFVVLMRSEADRVYIGDPVLGHKRYTMDEFVSGWNGIIFAVIGPGYDRENALLDPPEPLTAKHRINQFRPVQDAELMEFGFIQSDFF